MEQEAFLSGYCREIDQTRMVVAEYYEGELDISCSYANCPYAPNCTIAEKIREWEQARTAN